MDHVRHTFFAEKLRSGQLVSASYSEMPYKEITAIRAPVLFQTMGKPNRNVTDGVAIQEMTIGTTSSL